MARRVIGSGTIKDVGSLLRELVGGNGMNRVLVVTSERGSERRSFKYVENLLQRDNFVPVPFVLPAAVAKGAEPQLDSIERGIQAAKRAACTSVIGIGGGAVMDTAKIIAATSKHMMPNEIFKCCDTLSFDFDGIIKHTREITGNDPLGMISIPTVVCGGTETSSVSMFMDWDKDRRLELNQDFAGPSACIIDPDLVKQDHYRGILPNWTSRYLMGQMLGTLEYTSNSKDDLQDGQLFDLEDPLSDLENALFHIGSMDLERLLITSSLNGNYLHHIPFLPRASPHLLIARALCDNYPLQYSNTVAALLSPCKEFLRNKKFKEAITRIEMIEGDENIPRLLEQGIVLEEDDHMYPIGEIVNDWSDGTIQVEEVVDIIKKSL